LPDSLSSKNKKSQFGYILEGLEMENVGIFYDHLEYFKAIWYILWQCGIFFPVFGIFYGHLEYFMVILYILQSFGIFCSPLVYFAVIWYILQSFGIFCSHLVYFAVTWYVLRRKIGNPAGDLLQYFYTNAKTCLASVDS
jgi:hypothetical protein